jgi:hypothetical protein
LSLEGVVAFAYCCAVWHHYCHAFEHKLAQVLRLQAAAAAHAGAAAFEAMIEMVVLHISGHIWLYMVAFNKKLCPQR